MVELSHERILTNFKYQEPEFYPRLFDELEKGHFKVSLGRKKFDEIIKHLYLVLLRFMFLSKKIVLVCYVH